MMRETTPVKVTKGRMVDEETVEDHESFGTAAISVSSGGVRLFGSKVARHHSSVTLTIRRASRHHMLHRDWIMGGQELIEVRMSHAQFAAMITTPNQGTGTPCTIEFIAGKGMIPAFEPVETETERIMGDVGRIGKTLAKKIADRTKAVETLAESLPKKQREAMQHELAMLRQELESNVPFLIKSVAESTEKLVSEAKTEVEAFMNNAVREVGLKAIADGAQVPRMMIEDKEAGS